MERQGPMGDRIRRLSLLLSLLLVATAIMVFNSRSQLLIGDELMGYYTTTQPTVQAELHFQKTLPMVIEPPAYDLLVRASWSLFGSGALALRLPSILSILILIAALYLLLKELSGPRAALLGTLLVLFFRLIDYGWQERPYAFLLAMVAVATLCWHRASKKDHSRTLELVLLFLSLALAVNSHYFGGFALLAFFLAEAVRTLRRRKPDTALAAALLAACASAALTLPFLRAGMQYRGHTVYSVVTWTSILRTYQWTLNFAGPLARVPHGFAVYTVLLVGLALLGSAWSLLLRRQTDIWVLIAGLLLLPVPAVAVDMFFLHSYLPRYVIYENVGLILGLALWFGPWLNRISRAAYLLTAGLAVLLCGVHQAHLYRETKNDNNAALATMNAPPAVLSLLQTKSSASLFVTFESCLTQAYYGSPLVRQHLACVYDEGREMRYGQTNQVALISKALMKIPGFRIVTYDQMLATPGMRIVEYDPQAWEAWLPDSLQADGITTVPMGKGLGGDLVRLGDRKIDRERSTVTTNTKRP